jgi:hypothetical protein
MLERPELTILRGADSTERQIEKSWQQHQPARNRIPSPIRRKLQSLKKELEPTSARIKQALQDEVLLRSLVEQCTRRRGIARQRLFKTVRRTFAEATVKIINGDILEISWLAPSPAVIANPKQMGERQSCTLVCYAVAWPTPPFGIRLSSAWSFECPDHAAGRLLQRSGIDADFRSALFEAAGHFYGANMAAVAPHVGRNSEIYLPAGRGAFLATVVGARSGTNRFVYARAATFLDETMLGVDQQPLPQAADAKGSVAALLLE